MTWLTLWFALQTGVCPNSEIITYPPTLSFSPVNAYYMLTSELRAFDGLVFVGCQIRSELSFEKLNGVMPQMISYGFNAGLRWKGIELGYMHISEHPSVSYYGVWKPDMHWDGWWNEIYLKFSGEIKLF